MVAHRLAIIIAAAVRPIPIMAAIIIAAARQRPHLPVRITTIRIQTATATIPIQTAATTAVQTVVSEAAAPAALIGVPVVAAVAQAVVMVDADDY